jgi:hypothetical protein
LAYSKFTGQTGEVEHACKIEAPQDLYNAWKGRLDVVAHTCNPSYLGCGDWEDYGSRLSWAKS